jgi:hypothetical protein
MKKIPGAVLAVAFVTVAGPSFAADGILARQRSRENLTLGVNRQ